MGSLTGQILGPETKRKSFWLWADVYLTRSEGTWPSPRYDGGEYAAHKPTSTSQQPTQTARKLYIFDHKRLALRVEHAQVSGSSREYAMAYTYGRAQRNTNSPLFEHMD